MNERSARLLEHLQRKNWPQPGSDWGRTCLHQHCGAGLGAAGADGNVRSPVTFLFYHGSYQLFPILPPLFLPGSSSIGNIERWCAAGTVKIGSADLAAPPG
jgi:hypothetical protein